tara:strand:+ start:243 stop:614 length:372 start_codon:yes stop_codon:yes gene_type:complete
MILFFLPFLDPYFPLVAECTKCNLETTFSGHMLIRTNERRHKLLEYQCQNCGILTFEDKHYTDCHIAGLEERCMCGGQFRRDRNIFCPGCKNRKGNKNCEEFHLQISFEEFENIKEQHGKEKI